MPSHTTKRYHVNGLSWNIREIFANSTTIGNQGTKGALKSSDFVLSEVSRIDKKIPFPTTNKSIIITSVSAIIVLYFLSNLL